MPFGGALACPLAQLSSRDSYNATCHATCSATHTSAFVYMLESSISSASSASAGAVKEKSPARSVVTEAGPRVSCRT